MLGGMSIHSIDAKRPPIVRDIVVVGGSAGGLSTLGGVLSRLPEDCRAAIFVVLHIPDDRPSRVAEVLQKCCAMPVRFGEDEQPIEPGTVTVAQRDAHLLLGVRHVHLRRGPRENGFRPAIDPLFRSAVVNQGGRAIGVIVSGALHDGASGARALSRVGAPILVEHPDRAEYPQLPLAVSDIVDDARCLAIADLSAALVETIGTPGRPSVDVPEDVRLELMVSTLEKARMSTEHRLGALTPFNCPDCNGVLWEIEDGPMVRYRCHTGHAFTSDVLENVQEKEVERKLYEALRAQRERAHLLRSMAARAPDERGRSRLEGRAEGYDEDSSMIESLLLSRAS